MAHNSCFGKTEKCPIYNYDEVESNELLKCQRSTEVWGEIAGVSFIINVNYNAVMYGAFLCAKKKYI